MHKLFRPWLLIEEAEQHMNNQQSDVPEHTVFAAGGRRLRRRWLRGQVTPALDCGGRRTAAWWSRRREAHRFDSARTRGRRTRDARESVERRPRRDVRRDDWRESTGLAAQRARRPTWSVRCAATVTVSRDGGWQQVLLDRAASRRALPAARRLRVSEASKMVLLCGPSTAVTRVRLLRCFQVVRKERVPA